MGCTTGVSPEVSTSKYGPPVPTKALMPSPEISVAAKVFWFGAVPTVRVAPFWKATCPARKT